MIPYRSEGVQIVITFQRTEIPASVLDATPEIFTDAPDSYCCTAGGFIEGITGCGKTPLIAMKAFDTEYQKRKNAGTLPNFNGNKHTSNH
ncbi:MAG TPA: hypothetical protein VD993_04915 [Chitinophagaceae bacterium]|nr:hypothetical protein [Chitinophagaceae bacterium]